jgi:hypothetical protein
MAPNSQGTMDVVVKQQSGLVKDDKGFFYLSFWLWAFLLSPDWYISGC